MEIPVFTVDAFTNLPFKGNPAAVCLLQNELPVELYQKIAAEMNLSETAFITRLNSTDDFCSGARFGLRWFTPKNEVELCGHATLASAAVLFYKKGNTNPVLAFETLSGELLVHQRGESLVLDFPLNKPEIQDPKNFKDLLKAAVGDLPVQEVCYSKSIRKLLVCLADSCNKSALTSLNPVAESLLSSEKSGEIKSIVITVKGTTTTPPGYDFYSRNFAPWHGIPEDPVTGSAHTLLAPYWSEKLGKKKMLGVISRHEPIIWFGFDVTVTLIKKNAYQCSRRGGELQLELRDDDRVDIAGQAVVILEGTLRL